MPYGARHSGMKTVISAMTIIGSRNRRCETAQARIRALHGGEQVFPVGDGVEHDEHRGRDDQVPGTAEAEHHGDPRERDKYMDDLARDLVVGVQPVFHKQRGDEHEKDPAEGQQIA
jgi:hypothetical protein